MKKRILASMFMILVIVPPIIFGDASIFGAGTTGSYIGRYFFGSILFIFVIFATMEGTKAVLGEKSNDKRILSISWMMSIAIAAVPYVTTFLTPFEYTNIEFTSFYVFTIFIIIIGTFILSRFENVSDKEVRYIFLISFLVSSMSFGYLMIDTIAGWEVIFYMILICASVDTFGLLVGKYFGKNKIAPKISPNKTVEGFIGGVLMATIIGTIWLSLLLGDSTFFSNLTMSKNSALFVTSAFFTSLALSLVSFSGDLLFSYIKRQKGIKDFGKLIPGHGGILDRIDSHLVVNLLVFTPIFITFT